MKVEETVPGIPVLYIPYAVMAPNIPYNSYGPLEIYTAPEVCPKALRRNALISVSSNVWSSV